MDAVRKFCPGAEDRRESDFTQGVGGGHEFRPITTASWHQRYANEWTWDRVRNTGYPQHEIDEARNAGLDPEGYYGARADFGMDHDVLVQQGRRRQQKKQ